MSYYELVGIALTTVRRILLEASSFAFLAAPAAPFASDARRGCAMNETTSVSTHSSSLSTTLRRILDCCVGNFLPSWAFARLFCVTTTSTWLYPWLYFPNK